MLSEDRAKANPVKSTAHDYYWNLFCLYSRNSDNMEDLSIDRWNITNQVNDEFVLNTESTL